MNSAIIIGNLTKDPEVRESVGALRTTICRFTVAVNDGYGEKKHTSYLPVKVFGKTAENCGRYLEKGAKVCVRGRIETGSYQKQDGTKAYTTDIIANEVEFLPKGETSETKGQPQYNGFEAFSEQEEVPF